MSGSGAIVISMRTWVGPVIAVTFLVVWALGGGVAVGLEWITPLAWLGTAWGVAGVAYVLGLLIDHHQRKAGHSV